MEMHQWATYLNEPYSLHPLPTGLCEVCIVSGRCAIVVMQTVAALCPFSYCRRSHVTGMTVKGYIQQKGTTVQPRPAMLVDMATK